MRKPMGVIRRDAMVGSAKVYNSELEISQEDIIANLKSQLEKRDQLIAQVYPVMFLHRMDCVTGGDIEELKEVEQWLKQVEDLKGGK